MDVVMKRIMNSDNWPSIPFPENLGLINEIADNSFAQDNFEGKFASLLMYHQIIEAMCLHLIDDCKFFIQLSVYPTTIKYKVPERKMLGQYISELKDSIDFPNKDIFLEKISSFNILRNNIVHELNKSNIEMLYSKISPVKLYFDEIYEIYAEIQDNFRVDFHGFKKDVFIDYLEEDDDYFL